MLQDQIHNGMFAAQQIQYPSRGGEMSTCSFIASIRWLKPETVEKDIRKLLRRIEIERFANRVKHLFFNLGHAFLKSFAGFYKEGQIKRNTRHLHIRKDRR